MTEQQLILIVALALVAAVVIAGLVILNRRKTERLKSRFGSEYTRVVDETGSRRKAEAGLAAREKRVDAITIVPLTPTDRDHYTTSWRRLQSEFVDDPKYAVTHADHLLSEVMTKRGYPMGDFEQRAADISVDHAQVVQNYRAVHEIILRQGRGQASTEDLRRAMILFRDLFDELIGEQVLVGGSTAPNRAVA